MHFKLYLIYKLLLVNVKNDIDTINDNVVLSDNYKRHSAPPLCKRSHRGYHSNPICSLKTDSLHVSNNKSYSKRNTYTGIQHKLNNLLIYKIESDDKYNSNKFLRCLENDDFFQNRNIKILNIKNLDVKPKLIDRELFTSNVIFLKQVSNKFLIIKIDGNLIAIDQHAADERIRYEKYINMLYNDLTTSTNNLLNKISEKYTITNISANEYQVKA